MNGCLGSLTRKGTHLPLPGPGPAVSALGHQDLSPSPTSSPHTGQASASLVLAVASCRVSAVFPRFLWSPEAWVTARLVLSR